MNVEIGTEAAQFPFWEYIHIQIYTVSLQCVCVCTDHGASERMNYICCRPGIWIIFPASFKETGSRDEYFIILTGLLLKP
jgi:hypothetical protein